LADAAASQNFRTATYKNLSGQVEFCATIARKHKKTTAVPFGSDPTLR